jgi:L-serine dehydratase
MSVRTGEDPATVDTSRIAERVAAIQQSGMVLLGGKRPVPFELILQQPISAIMRANERAWRTDDDTSRRRWAVWP